MKIKYLSIIILIFSPLVCLKAFNQMSAEIKWREIAHKSLAGQTEQMLPIYQSLYSKLHNNELFLYNYTAELNFARQYKESLIIAKKCERLWADYDLQILMADNYLQLKNYKEAERYYKRAATMCPVKFVPLYKLAKLYKTTEHKESALNLAKLIINKEIKVRSSIIDKIITEMLHLVETLEDT